MSSLMLSLGSPGRIRRASGVGGSDPALILAYTTTSASQEVLLPLNGTLDVTIDWGDGTTDENVTTPDPTHTYATAGTYEVRVTGSATGLGKETAAGNWRFRMTGIQSFGNIGLTSLDYLLHQRGAAVTLPDSIPSTVTSTYRMCYGMVSVNPDVSTWDVSNVTNMDEMFRSATAFNQDLSGWNVTHIPSAPVLFDNGATAWVLPKPVWGTDGT